MIASECSSAPVQVVAAALTWVYTDELDASLDGTTLLQVRKLAMLSQRLVEAFEGCSCNQLLDGD